MSDNHNIFLPGGFKQFRLLKSKYTIAEKIVLVIGAGSEQIAQKMLDAKAISVNLIVNDYESLIKARLLLSKESKITVKMMDYDNTDFEENEIDLLYAQASISTSDRNKIIKEVKRILKPDGVLCVSELTVLQKDYPPFIRDIFDSSDILPLLHEKCKDYYLEKKFEILFEEDMTSSLKSFYESAVIALKETIPSLSDQEKSYHKKLLNKISHESNAYLKLGGDKYIGLKMLILKRN